MGDEVRAENFSDSSLDVKSTRLLTAPCAFVMCAVKHSQLRHETIVRPEVLVK